MPCHLRAVEGHGEEEAQRRNRAVDARRTHAGLRLVQLKTAKILGRSRIRRAAEEGCERPDVPDIVVARLLELRTLMSSIMRRRSGLMGFSLIGGAPVLRWRDPLILKTGRPACHPISPGHSIAATGSAVARSALPRKRVRCVLGMLSSLEVKVLRST